jgi:hypothetical protein
MYMYMYKRIKKSLGSDKRINRALDAILSG